MSTWTHIAGVIRVDDFNALFDTSRKLDFSKIFIRNTWNHRNKNGNLPAGSEGSIDVEFIERLEDEDSAYMRTICFFGDLRDFDNNDCKAVEAWWYNIPNTLPRCEIRQAVLQIICEDKHTYILTEKNMDIKLPLEEEDDDN